MGTTTSSISDSKNISIKQASCSAKDLLTQLEDGWFTANGDVSKQIQDKPGRIWTYYTDLPPEQGSSFQCAAKKLSSELCFPTDGSYGSLDVMERKIKCFVKEFAPKERKPSHLNTHDNISALAGQILFYDYDFNVMDKEDRTTQVFDLKDQREICGFAFLPAPLKYYPIGKNYKTSQEPHRPFLLFAEPENLIIRIKVDGENSGSMACPVNREDLCFLSLSVKEVSDMKSFRKIPILVTARKEKVQNWHEDGNELFFESLQNFALLLKSLSPGKHKIELSVHFSYKQDNVGALDYVNTTTNARGRWGPPQEDRFILGEMETVNTASLHIKCEPDEVILSEELSKGCFEVIIPEESEILRSMQLFYRFQNSLPIGNGKTIEKQNSPKLRHADFI